MIKPIALISFTVVGCPQSRGSKVPVVKYRKVGRRRVPVLTKDGRVIVKLRDSNRESGPWMEVVKARAKAEMLARGLQQPFDGCLVLRCVFFLARPKFHFTPKGKLRDRAPAFPNVTPDASKLLRAVEDALSKVVYVDDKVLVSSYPDKRYCGPGELERVTISLARLPATVEEAGAWGEKRLFEMASQ